MPNQFRLQPHRLEQIATELDAVYAGDYGDVLNSLRRVNDTLSGAWIGPSSTAFRDLHGTWITQLETVGHDLPLIATFLRAAADEYRRLDNERRAAVIKPQRDASHISPDRRASGRGHWSDSPSYAENGPDIPVIKQGLLPQVTPHQAQAMFDWVKAYSWDPANPNARFSWAYTPDGCYARAELMNTLLEQQFGITPWKVWAFDPTGLLRPDVDYGGSQIAWDYHVATLISVRDEQGEERPYVIDPSLANGPVTMQEWAGLMNAQSSAELAATAPGQPVQYPRHDGPIAASNFSPVVDTPVFYKDGVLVEYSKELMENFNQCVANGEQWPLPMVPEGPDACGYPPGPGETRPTPWSIWDLLR